MTQTSDRRTPRRAPTVVAYDLRGAGRTGTLDFCFVAAAVIVRHGRRTLAVIARSAFKAWILDPVQPLVRGDFEMALQPLAPMWVRAGTDYVLLPGRVVDELRDAA